jgi:hypothetical protein
MSVILRKPEKWAGQFARTGRGRLSSIGPYLCGGTRVAPRRSLAKAGRLQNLNASQPARLPLQV